MAAKELIQENYIRGINIRKVCKINGETNGQINNWYQDNYTATREEERMFLPYKNAESIKECKN